MTFNKFLNQRYRLHLKIIADINCSYEIYDWTIFFLHDNANNQNIFY